MRWISGAFGRYVAFRGRARRREFWLFVLIGVIVSNVLRFAGLDSPTETMVFLLVVLVPALSVTVRRLHDGGHSVYPILLPLIPAVGLIILVVYLCGDSESGVNRHGPSPKFRPAHA
jgi:uncharacterized membrane protein YhaH (DUF805 family)